MSTPTNEQWSALLKAINFFYNRSDVEPFRAPVDWQNLGLFDYPKVIKKPMDLGTIKKGIMDRKYKSIQEAADDVRLVWSNCMTYNADGSDFFILAQNMNKKWQDKYKKLLQDLKMSGGGSGATSGSKGDFSSQSEISLDDKRTFAKSLYKISREELGRVLVEVEMKCPGALVKNSAEDEVDFNIDKIPPNVFAELQEFVKTCSAKGKKKASGGGSSAKRQKV